ncbi:MAG: A/G-specific adenine glycosylase [Phycisphaerae bacterium]|nr:A/G-specific adenine glycosylase [Phycisphaerae bacterium]
MRGKKLALLQKSLSHRLISWFSAHQRPLPWRQTTDPYLIWVSEIMLQQTQVATVVPYFSRFILHYPSVHRLAAAPLEEVLSLWAGLGYYSRATRLHRCAKFICTYRNGRFPSTRTELMALPGIGRYTAGAIASIAFGQSVPVLDGNVIRVLTRLLAIPDDIAAPVTHTLLWAIADQLVPSAHAGTYNQAIMELGATVCLPRHPHCGRCPVQGLCLAHRRSLQNALPVKTAAPRPRKSHCLTVVIEAAGKFLLLKRPPGGLWSSLWEFPTFHTITEPTTANRAAHIIRSALGLYVNSIRPISPLRHQLTHRTFEYQIWHARMDMPPPGLSLPDCDRGQYQDFAWVHAVAERPCGAITRKIRERLC